MQTRPGALQSQQHRQLRPHISSTSTSATSTSTSTSLVSLRNKSALKKEIWDAVSMLGPQAVLPGRPEVGDMENQHAAHPMQSCCTCGMLYGSHAMRHSVQAQWCRAHSFTANTMSCLGLACGSRDGLMGLPAQEKSRINALVTRLQDIGP